VFQKIVEIFHLEHLIGSTPEATNFQAAFCLVMYNLLQVSWLERLLGGAWKEHYRKAINKKERPKLKKAKGSGDHTSVEKILEAERNKRRQPQGVP
jgi:hypothetical protein